jgi:hypothetical protein
MKRLRTVIKHLPVGPPTGPLTTAEAAKAEELRQKRQKTLARDDERIKREPAEAADQESNSSSP